MKSTIKPPKSRGAASNGNGHSTVAGQAESILAAGGQRTAKQKATVGVQLITIEKRMLQFRIVSETPLIVHNFSAKERQRMLDKHMGKVVKKEVKDPVQCFRDSLYVLPNGAGFGVPARAFKASIVTVANDVGLMKTQMKRAMRILGPDMNPNDVDALIPLELEPITTPITAEDKEYADKIKDEHRMGASMRQDVVRLESGVADIRFRGWFPKWACTINVIYNHHMLSQEQLLSLVDAAGFGSGIMEWRPSAPKSDSGQYGCWAVDTSVMAKEIAIKK